MFDDYTVTTKKSFDEAVDAVRAKALERGFKILHIHDIQAMLAEEGFHHEPLKIIEICNGEFGSQMLTADVKLGLIMPCKINVYVKDGQTYISALRPRMLGDFFPSIADQANEEDELNRSIVNESK